MVEEIDGGDGLVKGSGECGVILKALLWKISDLKGMVESLVENNCVLHSKAPNTGVLPSKASADDGGWKVVEWTRSTVRLRKSITERFECQNSFQAFAEVQEEEEAKLQGIKDRKADATSLPRSKVLVVEDSQIIWSRQ